MKRLLLALLSAASRPVTAKDDGNKLHELMPPPVSHDVAPAFIDADRTHWDGKPPCISGDDCRMRDCDAVKLYLWGNDADQRFRPRRYLIIHGPARGVPVHRESAVRPFSGGVTF